MIKHFLVIVAVLFWSSASIADEPKPAPTAAASVTTPTEVAPAPEATAVVATPEPTNDVLISQTQQVYADWTKLGWLAGVITLVNLLTNLLKVGTLKQWFIDKKRKWLLPFVSLALGVLAGGLTAWQSGQGAVQSILAGVFAGVGSVGFHEIATKVRPSKRTA